MGSCRAGDSWPKANGGLQFSANGLSQKIQCKMNNFSRSVRILLGLHITLLHPVGWYALREEQSWNCLIQNCALKHTLLYCLFFSPLLATRPACCKLFQTVSHEASPTWGFGGQKFPELSFAHWTFSSASRAQNHLSNELQWKYGGWLELK